MNVLNFDLRASYDELKIYLNSLDLKSTIFVGYNISGAEVPCLCQIMGRQWACASTWIDLWTEFKMFALTHTKYRSNTTGLSECISSLGIVDQYQADKEGIRDLIIYDSRNQALPSTQKKDRLETKTFEYTDEEYKKIEFYCSEDAKILLFVMDKLKNLWGKYHVEKDEVLRRGQHCKYMGISFFFHKGYPVDTDLVKSIFENIPKIKTSIQENCNAKTGYQIYEAKYVGRKNEKVFSHYQFNMETFSKYLEDKKLNEVWEKTKTGYKLQEDYIEEMLSAYKDILEPIYTARNTIKQLNSTDLSKLLTPDGYIKSVSWPFHQKTGRTSPKPKLGFLLNLTPWLRMLIKPKPGRAFVGIDFKSQEVLIAACLSKDKSMLEDYLGDIYMGQAIKTGFAPKGATKKSHPILRDNFKPIVLGVNFGMQERSLSLRFYNLFKSLGQEKTQNECFYQAKKFLNSHKNIYYKYYKFLEDHFIKAKNKGYYKTQEGWYYFVDSTTRLTQLQNVPCQATGGEILRLAHDICVAQGIDVIGLHDALYFECSEDETGLLCEKVSNIMKIASSKILGFDYMGVESKIFTNQKPYYDVRGVEVFDLVIKTLNLKFEGG
jgi:DNA polymerase I-like protein with 3'-5' exonuclease and polymerase domains